MTNLTADETAAIWHRHGVGCNTLDEAIAKKNAADAQRGQWAGLGQRHAECCDSDSIDAIEHDHAEALAEAADRQMAAWRMGHGVGHRPSRMTVAVLRERDHDEALAMDRQQDRDLGNAADSEQIGAWRARHDGRAPVEALAVDYDEARRENGVRGREVMYAYRLHRCPRCGSSPHVECQTSSGFYGGASGPHAARRKLAAAMSGDEIHAAWVQWRADRDESLRREAAMFERNRQRAEA